MCLFKGVSGVLSQINIIRSRLSREDSSDQVAGVPTVGSDRGSLPQEWGERVPLLRLPRIMTWLFGTLMRKVRVPAKT
jgi:hypothetical protein